MGTITSICKKDERTDIKGEYVSTKSAAINNLEETEMKNGKEGNISFKDKEFGISSIIDNSNYDKNNDLSLVVQNRNDDSKQESINQKKEGRGSKTLRKIFCNKDELYNNSNQIPTNNVSNLFNNSFTNNTFIHDDFNHSSNVMIQSNEEKLNLRKEYIKNYTTLTLLKAEEIADIFNKDNYRQWNISESSINKIINPSLQLKDEIFSLEEENYSIYYGQINKKSQKHGFGVFLINSGEKYEGYWENDVFRPYGRYINIKGEILEGAFDNWKLHGQGKFISQDKTYIGSFFYGLKNGFGKEVTDAEEYEGEFKNDKKDGKGKLIFKHSDNNYSGEFKDGKLTGNGEFTWKGGDKFVGTIVNGVFEGKGKYFWKDGNFYEGNYENGIRKGLGVFKWKDGRIYKGEFDSNVPHGNGIIIDKGIEKNVRFNKGNIVKNDKQNKIEVSQQNKI